MRELGASSASTHRGGRVLLAHPGAAQPCHGPTLIGGWGLQGACPAPETGVKGRGGGGGQGWAAGVLRGAREGTEPGP